MTLDLVPLWAAIMAFAVFMYVLLDGFDLGVGILFGYAPDDRSREHMIASVAPIWDGNETWLVMGGVGLFAAFPVAYAVILPALYFPLLFMLLGLICRGVAFEFRGMPGANRRLWDHAFHWGSLIATFAQGVVLGTFVEGFEVSHRQFAGGSFDWLRPFALLVGLGLVVGYALIGACWLILKTEGPLQEWARLRTRVLLAGVLAFIALVSIWTPLMEPRVFDRWFSWPNIAFLSPVPLITAALAWWLWRGLERKRDLVPFLAALGLFLMCYLGLAISIWPMVVPYQISLWDAAASNESHVFLALGTMFLLPVVVTYTAWSYWVFRGKVRGEGGYHH